VIIERPKTIRQLFGKGFGAHSIKHGAMTQLVYHAALGELRTDQLEIIEKHKSKAEISRATVRYLQDRTAAARMLRQFAGSEAPYRAATRGKARKIIPTRADALFSRNQKAEKGLDEADDIELMVDSMNFSSSKEVPKRVGIIFTRAEKKKNKRRQLYWPEQLNEELKAYFGKQPIELEDPVLHAANVQQGMYARCFDMEKSFLQMGLTPEVQQSWQILRQLYCTNGRSVGPSLCAPDIENSCLQ
jgi:hypothetical protein